MAGPAFGALGATFKIVRALQAISLIAIIGMAANFVSDMVSNNNTASDVLVGTLSVVCPPSPQIWYLLPTQTQALTDYSRSVQTCIAVLYCAITLILYLDSALPYILTTAFDSLILIALIVVAGVVGKPLSYLNCKVIGSNSTAESAAQLSYELSGQLHDMAKGHMSSGKVVYSNWIGASKAVCYEMKAIWGLSIALW